MNESRQLLPFEEWISIQMFLKGRTNVHDGPRCRRPSTSTESPAFDAVKSIVLEDRRVTLDEILARLPANFHTSLASIGRIVSDKLELRKVYACYVPRLLSQERKEKRIAAAFNLLDMFRKKEDDLVNRIVTGVKHGFVITLLKRNDKGPSGKPRVRAR